MGDTCERVEWENTQERVENAEGAELQDNPYKIWNTLWIHIDSEKVAADP